MMSCAKAAESSSMLSVGGEEEEGKGEKGGEVSMQWS